MELIVLDDGGRLYLSADPDEWTAIEAADIRVVIDLDGCPDTCVPTTPDGILFLYFPFNDADLPNLERLHAVARLGATLVAAGQRVLSHCGLGYNRSALIAGLILRYLGASGPEAVARLRERRPGALYNRQFAEYVETCELPSPAVR